MEGKFEDILNSVIAKPGRSRLEPYGEFIDELRRRGLTYRDIAGVLDGKAQARHHAEYSAPRAPPVSEHCVYAGSAALRPESGLCAATGAWGTLECVKVENAFVKLTV